MNALVVTTEAGDATKMFAVHAVGCADLAKREVFADARNLSEAAEAIAKCYGGYSDNGDAPANEKQALSWATIKACAKRAMATREGVR